MEFTSLMNTVSIVLLSVLIPVAVIAITILLIIFFKRRFFKQSQNMRKDYDYYHTMLTSDCKVMVNRLGTLGKSSLEYMAMYEDRNKQYESILNKRDKDMLTALDSLDSLLSSKDFKNAKEVSKQCSHSLEAYIKAITAFNDELTNLLRDDSDTREVSIVAKEKYRKIKSFYETNQSELKLLSNSFNAIFNSTEDTFAKFDDLANEAKFKEAKSLLPQITTILDAILDIIDDLPLLVMRTTTVIPEKLQKLDATYQEMLSEDYVLDYLNIPQETATINNTLKEITEKLKVLDVDGIKETLDSMQTHINDLMTKFEEEKQAKLDFENLQNKVSDSSFDLEKKYSRLVNELPEYEQTYKLDQKYVDQMIALKNDIEAIGFLKRELDSYLDTSAKQPYTTITAKIHDMQSEMDKVKRTINDYSDYLHSLRQISQDIFTSVRSYLYHLKKAEYQVRLIGVNSYQAVLVPRFQNLYERLAQIDKLVITTPVDVPTCQSLYQDFKNDADLLLVEINKRTDEADKAEQAIVYANAFRVDFHDSRQLLDSAEAAFAEADFTRSQSVALQVIKAFGQDSLTQNTER